MSKKTNGQSMVELGLLLPFMLLILFGIIDLSYYIYGYQTIFQAARNGSEKASLLPPTTASLTDSSDTCVVAILDEISKGTVFYSDLATLTNVTISYPSGRALGQPVEIAIVYKIAPLTPVMQFASFGTGGTLTVRVTSRRSIESLASNPSFTSGTACT